MAKVEKRERGTALYETILKLKDLDECCRFFEDLCTPTELRSLEQRFDVAVYLQQGLVYLDILEKTGASSATISRVRRSMLDNGAGGVMQEVIAREGLHEKEEPEGRIELAVVLHPIVQVKTVNQVLCAYGTKETVHLLY